METSARRAYHHSVMFELRRDFLFVIGVFYTICIRLIHAKRQSNKCNRINFHFNHFIRSRIHEHLARLFFVAFPAIQPVILKSIVIESVSSSRTSHRFNCYNMPFYWLVKELSFKQIFHMMFFL